MLKQNQNKFEQGIFWELYVDLERQFNNFLDYVPYLQGNEKTYSFKLLNLILSIGGHVDSAFKEMIRFQGLPNIPQIQKMRQKLQRVETAMSSGNRPRKGDQMYMWDCFTIFENIYKLSERSVEYKILPKREYYKPFKLIKDSPSSGWWGIYNGLKHHLGYTLKEANLRNTLDALATAFLLNVIHEPAILRLYDYEILKFYTVVGGRRSKHTPKTIPQKIFNDLIRKQSSFWGSVETFLFIYDYNQ